MKGSKREAKMKAVLYARVSSKEQEETGYSLQAQEKLLTEYALRRGLVAVKVFSVSESASGKKQREIFNEMLAFAKKNHVKVIVCEKVDRLTRNFKDAVLVDEWMNGDTEREIHLVKENCVLNQDAKSHEKLMWHMKVSIAQFYTNNLSEEVKKGQKEKIAQGWMPAKPPLGYKSAGESGRKIHVMDKEKAPFIKQMYERYATGNYSLETLTHALYHEGFISNNGKKVGKSRIADMLTDPFYMGKFRWLGHVYNGNHAPIVTKELFEKVQSVLRRKDAPKYSKRFYAFKGLIKCGECGRSIVADTKKGHNYYYCTRFETNCTQKIYTREEVLESQLAAHFEKLKIKDPQILEWVRKALKESHLDQTAYRENALKELNQRHEHIRQRLDKLYDDKLDGIIENETYERKYKQYKTEAETLLEKMKAHDEADDRYFQLGKSLFEISQRAHEVYLNLPHEEQRSLLHLVFEDMRLKAGRLTVTYSRAFEVLREAVKATNGSGKGISRESEKSIFAPSKKPFTTGESTAFMPLCTVLQGRPDSNRQPAVLETAALPIRATPLKR